MAARGETLSRRQILRDRPLMRRIRQEGKRQGDRHLTLFTGASGDCEPTRAAFLTPKRLGNAVERNRLRRRMRDVHRRFVACPETGTIYIWSAKPPATALTYEQLKACMLKLARRHDRPTRRP